MNPYSSLFSKFFLVGHLVWKPLWNSAFIVDQLSINPFWKAKPFQWQSVRYSSLAKLAQRIISWICKWWPKWARTAVLLHAITSDLWMIPYINDDQVVFILLANDECVYRYIMWLNNMLTNVNTDLSVGFFRSTVECTELPIYRQQRQNTFKIILSFT